MREITDNEYQKFVSSNNKVYAGGVELNIGGNNKISCLEPDNFIQENYTVWSFPNRGKWATHYLNSKYRGNWSPYVVRNLILRYSKEGDVVLDQMVGSGTSMIECMLLNRKGIGIDINQDAVMLTRDRLNFNTLKKFDKSKIKTYVGDARNLDSIEDDSIDLIATHPPYAWIISYSKDKIENDLSKIKKIDEFIEEMKIVAKECFRVLKPGKHCAILMGDTRKHQHYIPIADRVMEQFLDVGFILRENIIKLQHNMKSTREKWKGRYLFYKIGHENLFVFRKPRKKEKYSMKRSMKWWKSNL